MGYDGVDNEQEGLGYDGEDDGLERMATTERSMRGADSREDVYTYTTEAYNYR